MMNWASSTFRSHLMQHFAATARGQYRPPISLFSIGSEPSGPRQAAIAVNDKNSPGRRFVHRRQSTETDPTPSPPPLHTISKNKLTDRNISCWSRFSSSYQSHSSDDEDGSEDAIMPTQHYLDAVPSTSNLRTLIRTRRTISNFLVQPHSSVNSASFQTPPAEFLRAAIRRSVECASTAPNHKVTEPTTFHHISSPSPASERLLDICYQVTLRRLREQKLSGEEACQSEAARKREKWATIPSFVVATVSGMEAQTPIRLNTTDDLFSEMPYLGPSNTRQLEDYASSCASIQNMLLSLHSEGLGSKWASGPIIRTLAFRQLIGCEVTDMVVGLIFVGWPKRVQRRPRRRRTLDGDLIREVELDVT